MINETEKKKDSHDYITLFPQFLSFAVHNQNGKFNEQAEVLLFIRGFKSLENRDAAVNTRWLSK